MQRYTLSLGSIFTLLTLSSVVYAAGFESSIPFGARSAGVAGIGTPYMRGSQALFFNPAGLAMDQGQDISLNVSPGWGKFSGPIADANVQEHSDSKILVPFSLMYARAINENWGVGAGLYASGGSYAEYKDVTFPSVIGNPKLISDLSLIEFALGTGYKIGENLRLGASWRVVMADAEFTSITGTATGVMGTELQDLKDTQYNAYKLGAQYKLSEKSELGFTYRSNVFFRAKGNVEIIDYTTTTAPTTVMSGDVTVGTVFPEAYTFGLTHQCTDQFQFLGEYVLTRYSKVTNLAVDIDGQAGVPSELKWKDQNEIRLAGEYSGMTMPIRLGYIWSSKVTNPDYASPTFTPPGSAQTLTLGSGINSGSLKFNGALEYGWSKGQGTGAAATYALQAYGIHAGASLAF